ncbi:polysaccharide pyruvyl transferase family protein [Pedobacter sp. MR2016-24]|uniref:polysaccharide pyruvyl transferase family protein n=1 Tax=Pedobacter sp. MR2016-24 TaxID=2994466 RepID=UPI002248479A|nr:polysaccharide pyruvyl transferase family protein [Pedobacter sp. MR2016-24]MCX2485279.1 polysaccharide pyruvyl transferase family protein [Pedobacter sp. MR2016-24]
MMMSYIQVQHRLRNIKQKISGVEVGVVGGYHGGNLGDIALGTSVTSVLEEEQIKTGMQTIYNLDKWPKAPYAIVGGGAVGYADSLTRVAERYKGDFHKVSLLGVDFNEKSYPEVCLELIRKAAYVSGRSEAQAEKLKTMTGRQDIHFHPDIAFSLYPDFCEKERAKVRSDKPGKLLVNIIPLYGKLINGEIVASDQYKEERPALYAAYEQMHSTYKALVRNVVEKAIADGLTVETIPFTPDDEAFGKSLLEGLEVKHAKYHADPLRMIKHMATATRVFATRYHTTIFALKLGIPLYPVAYAVKNELLFKELGVKRADFISSDDLAAGCNPNLETIKVDVDVIKNYEMKSRAAIVASVKALKVKV